MNTFELSAHGLTVQKVFRNLTRRNSSEILDPEVTWSDRAEFRGTAKKLAFLFVKNFANFKSGVSHEVKAARPKV